MSLLKAILDSSYTKSLKYIGKGNDVNNILNTTPPMSLLDLAIDTAKENPSSQANSIVELLKSNGALTYQELLVTRAKNNLPPLAKKGTVRGNIKTTGIAGLPRRGGRSRRNRTRKNRR